ncbi:MAG TPA: glutamate formimidoyltransferase [Clostridiales bacterium]|nr:glutamate formimidoyltransferase [Clostridiales bacterium]
MDRIVECVPNISEGRDLEKLEKILDVFRGKRDVKLLDYSSDEDHNRTVVTLVGEPEAVKSVMIEAIGKAVELIDLNKHEGQHPRMGAVDVVPFIPIRNVTVEEADKLAKEVAAEASRLYGLPFFLYEKSASAPHRENLANIRKGQFEGMAEKMKDEMWKPDFGPETVHPTAGVTAIGARMPLVAYNVNLATNNLDIANAIAKNVRHINGGFRYVKALGIELEDRGIVQVSMNLTDYTKSSIYRVFETIKMEAQRYGVAVVGSEIVGLVPLQAIVDTADYYLRLENFNFDQVLETRL